MRGESLVLAALLAAAAVPAPRRVPERDARAVARAIEARYHDARTLSALFLETYRAGRGDVRVESGKVAFLRPGLMRWDYEAPERKLFLVDGRHAWLYIPANHTASSTPVRHSADWRTPFALLTGRAKLGDLCARLRIVPNPGGPGAPPPDDTVLDCEPKKGEEFLNAQIEVDRLSRIVRVLIESAGDVETEVQFAHWEENAPLARSLFEFEPPPGVAVVNEQSLSGSTH